MKLYYSPGACSLATHIALREAGIRFEVERVDLTDKVSETGADYLVVNAKGYVPALLLDDGEVITESIAVPDHIAPRRAALGISGSLGRTRLLECLAYTSTELHKSLRPFVERARDAERAIASAHITKRLEYLAQRRQGDYLFGDAPTVADFYLFVMLLWAGKFAVAIPAPLVMLRDRINSRPAVLAAMRAEGRTRAPMLASAN